MLFSNVQLSQSIDFSDNHFQFRRNVTRNDYERRALLQLLYFTCTLYNSHASIAHQYQPNGHNNYYFQLTAFMNLWCFTCKNDENKKNSIYYRYFCFVVVII